MVQQVRKYPGQVSIYSGGALTNVALAVRMDPEFASLAKELVIMGGYVDVNLLQVTGSVLQADLSSDVSLPPSREKKKWWCRRLRGKCICMQSRSSRLTVGLLAD